jgi:hypothetical protein
MLNRISSGWTWLETALNAVIDEVNRQKPVASASIVVEESPNGTLLKTVSLQGTQSGTDPGAPQPPPDPPTGKGQWCQLAVIDTSGGQCVTKHLWYWGTPAA